MRTTTATLHTGYFYVDMHRVASGYIIMMHHSSGKLLTGSKQKNVEDFYL